MARLREYIARLTHRPATRKREDDKKVDSSVKHHDAARSRRDEDAGGRVVADNAGVTDRHGEMPSHDRASPASGFATPNNSNHAQAPQSVYRCGPEQFTRSESVLDRTCLSSPSARRSESWQGTGQPAMFQSRSISEQADHDTKPRFIDSGASTIGCESGQGMGHTEDPACTENGVNLQQQQPVDRTSDVDYTTHERTPVVQNVVEHRVHNIYQIRKTRSIHFHHHYLHIQPLTISSPSQTADHGGDHESMTSQPLRGEASMCKASSS